MQLLTGLGLLAGLLLPASQDLGTRVEVVPQGQQQDSDEEPVSDLVAQVDGATTAQLLDACSKFLGIPIEFDAAELQSVHRAIPGTLYTPRELLAAANRELEALSKTTIKPPGANILRVVGLAEAKALAGLHSTDGTLQAIDRPLPGYVRLIVPLREVEASSVQATIQKLLSSAGEVSTVGSSEALLISDLTPRVEAALLVLRGLDVPGPSPVIEEYTAQHVSATTLSARLEQLSAKHRSVATEKLEGTYLLLPESGVLLFIAPQREVGWWMAQAGRLDRPEPVRTINYTPRRFSLEETRDLVLAELAASPFGYPTPRMVLDGLTGTLVTTATPSCHDAINEILNRLEQTDSSPEPRLRVFQIENRPAGEVQALLSELLSEGVLQADPNAPGSVEGAAPAEGFMPNGTGGPADLNLGQQGTSTKSTVRAFRTSSSQTGGAGEASLTVDATTNQILAFGPPKILDRVAELIATLDLRQPQILVEATVVSLSESEALSLGVELAAISNDGDQLYQLASLFGVGAPDPSSLTLPAIAGTGAAGTVLDPGNFSAAVRALETVTSGRTLTRPKLLVNAGRTADLGSVLQTPFISTNASSTVSTTSLGGTLDAGTQILVTPQVSEAGRITLIYTVSISNFVGEASDPSLPPPRQENHIQSEVTIPDGYTVVVGGLEIESEGRDRAQVPLLGRIPLLGALFRDDAQSSSHNRFYVFLRCSVMQGDRFEGLRYLSGDVRKETGLPDDYPPIKPMVMR